MRRDRGPFGVPRYLLHLDKPSNSDKRVIASRLIPAIIATKKCDNGDIKLAAAVLLLNALRSLLLTGRHHDAAVCAGLACGPGRHHGRRSSRSAAATATADDAPGVPTGLIVGGRVQPVKGPLRPS